MEYSRRPTKSIPKENQLKILNKIYLTYLVSTTDIFTRKYWSIQNCYYRCFISIRAIVLDLVHVHVRFLMKIGKIHYKTITVSTIVAFDPEQQLRFVLDLVVSHYHEYNIVHAKTVASHHRSLATVAVNAHNSRPINDYCIMSQGYHCDITTLPGDCISWIKLYAHAPHSYLQYILNTMDTRLGFVWYVKFSYILSIPFVR